MIQVENYKQIIEVLPILCVDVVVKNSLGEYLLVKRANEPLKGTWWVVGGRVLKGEALEKAAIRKVREETSLVIGAPNPIGYYEDTDGTNPLGLESVQHSVSVVFSAMIDDHQKIKLDNQSSDWKFSKALPPLFCVKQFNSQRGRID